MTEKMDHNSIRDDRLHGGASAWESAWQSIESDNKHQAVLFTREKPATIVELWQRCYSDDLDRLIRGTRMPRLLELGSGRATTSMYMAANGHSDITLVDLSETALKIAAYNFEEEQLPRPTCVVADASATTMEGGQFDCIYNIGLLEHFEDPRGVLREAYRLLAEGGLIFMIIVPEPPLLGGLLSRLIFNPLSAAKMVINLALGRVGGQKDFYRSDMSALEYKDAAQSVGFRDVNCVPYNPYWSVHGRSRLSKRFNMWAYDWHYRVARKFKGQLALQTMPIIAHCYCLIGYK